MSMGRYRRFCNCIYNKNGNENKGLKACLLPFMLNSRMIFDCILFGPICGMKGYMKPEKQITLEKNAFL